jgi:hypothetical protein
MLKESNLGKHKETSTAQFWSTKAEYPARVAEYPATISVSAKLSPAEYSARVAEYPANFSVLAKLSSAEYSARVAEYPAIFSVWADCLWRNIPPCSGIFRQPLEMCFQPLEAEILTVVVS